MVVADDENLDLARAHGYDAVECPNDTMGRKWNAGFSHAASEGADIFVLIGSDDWLHPDALASLPTDTISAADALDFVDLERGVLQHARAERQIPWLIPRALLEPTSFTPFPDRIQRGTETLLWHALRHPDFTHRGGAPGVDFKTHESTGPYAGVANSIGDGIEHDAWTALAEHYPAHLVESARALSEEIA